MTNLGYMKMSENKLLFMSVALGVLLPLLFVGCKKKDYGKVTVTTKSVFEITANSAKSGGNVTATNNASVGMCGICWSEYPSPNTNDFVTTDSQGNGEYFSSMKNLKAGTKYYVRAYATTNSGVMYGEEKNFTTLSDGSGNGGGGNGGGNSGDEGTITVTTYGASEITTSSATCGGNVTVTGEVTITGKGVCYSTSHNPTIDNLHTSDGQGAGSFTSNLTGLSANTRYYVRAYAKDGSSITYGEEKNFTTNEQPQSPTVTVTLINVTPTYLELKFEPSNNTDYYCYNIGGTLTSTGHNVGVNTKKFKFSDGQYIQPDTEYEFSVVAYDANGTVGEIIHPKFRTSPAPYQNYYRVSDNFYKINYAKLINEPGSNSNLRLKAIILFSENNYYVRFSQVCYWYETDNNWSPGVYPLSGGYYVGECDCLVVANGHNYSPSNGEFTISKNGNMMTYDLYGDDGSKTAHFTGVPTN